MKSGRSEPRRVGAPFTEREAEFLAENMLGRLATVSPLGQPHVVPVAYRFDGSSVHFSGWSLEKSLKFRNLLSNSKVAFAVDEVVSSSPWRVRGVEIRGDAHPYVSEGAITFVKVIPRTVRSWGLGAI